MQSKLYLIGFLTCLLTFKAQASEKLKSIQNIRGSVFKIYTMSVQPDYYNPWNHFASESGNGSGFYIGSDQIMTNAHVVANARFLMVQRDGDSEPVPARIKYIAHDCDLAILTVEQPGYFKSIRPMQFGPVPKLLSPVSAVGYPRGGDQISITDGVVSRIGFDVYSHDRFSRHFLIQVDSAINPGNSGGPVVQNGEVVGVAFQGLLSAQNTGYIIPIPVVKRFLKDVADGRYDGHPAHGIEVQDWFLVNPAAKSFYGVQGSHGIIVRDLAPYNEATNHLKLEDVITKVDEHNIGLDGKINLFGERVDFRAWIDLKQINDTVSFEVIRERKKININYKLKENLPFFNRAKEHVVHPRFFVVGGMVYSTLSSNLLTNWGNQWFRDAPYLLRYIFSYYERSVFRNFQDILVFINKLNHPINTHVQTPTFSVVRSVNGKEVLSLFDFVNAVQSNEQEYLRIDYDGFISPTIFKSKDLQQISQEIVNSYKVNPPMWLEESFEIH